MLLDTLEEGAFVLAENLIEPAIVKVPAENISKFLPNDSKTDQTPCTHLSVTVYDADGCFSFFAVPHPSAKLLQTEW